MKKHDIRQKLCKYLSGGNAYLILDHLLDKKTSEIKITQAELAEELHKTRPSILTSLELLKKEGIIEYSYGKITILGASNVSK